MASQKASAAGRRACRWGLCDYFSFLNCAQDKTNMICQTELCVKNIIASIGDPKHTGWKHFHQYQKNSASAPKMMRRWLTPVSQSKRWILPALPL